MLSSLYLAVATGAGSVQKAGIDCSSQFYASDEWRIQAMANRITGDDVAEGKSP